MARTQVSTFQVLDGSIRRVDLNIATAGSAVITKAIQGTGITLSSTGADAGTGDVTISTNASDALDAISSTRGTILYRGASGWAALAPGTVGQVLQTGGAGADPSWGDMAQAAVISTANSSTSTLTASATFTGTSESTLTFGSVSVLVLASHASAADGLAVEQSSDGTNWDVADYLTIAANQAQSVDVNLVSEFFRVVYVNGGTTQTTFRLETKKNPWPVSVIEGNRSNAPSLPAVATLTTTGDAAIIAAPGTNKSILLRTVKSYNTSATLTRVDLKDGTTVFAYLAAAASGGGEVYRPYRRLLTENTALNGALSSAVTDVRISAEYVIVKS